MSFCLILQLLEENIHVVVVPGEGGFVIKQKYLK